MTDLMQRLAGLGAEARAHADDDVVAGDLRRARAALVNRRRRRRTAVAGTTVGLVAVGTLSYVATGRGGTHPDAARTHSTRHLAPPNAAVGSSSSSSSSSLSSPSAPTTSVSRTVAKGPAVELVAYRGKQLPGFTVKRIPKGYVLQGISSGVLDVARRNDHSPLDSFVGKISVTLNDHAGPKQGTRVSVNGHPGWVYTEGGIQQLVYNDGTHNVDVQAWSDIVITPKQLAHFAAGVTVLPGAAVSQG